MSKSNTWETDLLTHLFNNGALANYGDATGLVGSTTPGSLYVSLHTADPGEAGDQTTSEATYTSYARVAVARSSAGWTISSPAGVGTVQNTAVVTFPTCTGSTNTITYVGVGTLASGAGKLLYSGALSSSLSVSTGIQPQFDTSTNRITITED